MQVPHEFPLYSARERVADGLIHVVGVAAGLIGAAWLLAAAGGRATAGELASLAAYSLGLVGMLTASAGYNLARRGPRKALLRRIDHAMIFVMIAGTYTPLLLKGLGGTAAGTALFAVVWGVALTGAALKLWCPWRIERASLLLYLGLGWVVVLVAEPLSAALSATAWQLLAAGGLLYTAGVAFHVLDRLRYHNALWHLTVLGAAACHFAAISAEYVPA
ncbi:MAG TPA: hemolysin III family protein [Azospirillum sp.]